MSASTSAFVQGLSRLQPPLDGQQPAWLKGLRRSAFQWVSEHGFPTAKDEAWKYTRVAPMLQHPFAAAEPDAPCRLTVADIDRLAGDLGGIRLVFVNGHHAPSLGSLKDLPEGAKVSSLAHELGAEDESLELLLGRLFRTQPDAFTALNAACAEDGAFVRIPARATITEPIHLVFVSDPGATPLVSHPRSLVLAGAGSQATIVESHVGIAGEVYLSNAVTELVLEEGAVLEHYKIQNETETAFHVALLGVQQGRDSRFAAHSVALGAALARHEARVRLVAPGAATVLNGLYMASGQQHLDNPSRIEHAAPHCTSRELYKGVIDGHGRGVFDGRVVVREGAFKTDAAQTNKNLLLSASAQADTRPQLEIYADDVKCAHGAAVGQLDEEALFYLSSRGIPEGEARGLLTYAFANEMVELIRVEPLRSQVEKLVARRLGTTKVAA